MSYAEMLGKVYAACVMLLFVLVALAIAVG